jgi:hypothetical protein
MSQRKKPERGGGTMSEPEQVELSQESAKRFAKQVAGEVLAARTQPEPADEIRANVKKQADLIIDAVKAGLDNGTISEQEILSEYVRSLKAAVRKQDEER